MEVACELIRGARRPWRVRLVWSAAGNALNEGESKGVAKVAYASCEYPANTASASEAPVVAQHSWRKVPKAYSLLIFHSFTEAFAHTTTAQVWRQRLWPQRQQQ